MLRADRTIDETFDRAWRMLRMRRMLRSRARDLPFLPHSRALVSYYSNSIAHLLGPFEAAVSRARFANRRAPTRFLHLA